MMSLYGDESTFFKPLTAEDKRKRNDLLASRGKLLLHQGSFMRSEVALAVLCDDGDSPPWHCHMCSKLNRASADKCEVCGRPSTWTVARGYPLHGLGVGASRRDHVAAALDRGGGAATGGGEDPNRGVEDGWVPLHFAAYEGNPEAISVLLSRGALIESSTEKGWTPLLMAASQNQLGAAKVLIDAGANVNHRSNGEQSTALHLATEEGFLDMIKLLLDGQSNPNSVNLLGRTPLHLAAEAGDVAAAAQLLAAGAHVDALDKDGWLPVQIAEVKGFEDFIVYLDKTEHERLQAGVPIKTYRKQSSEPYSGGLPLTRQLSAQHSRKLDEGAMSLRALPGGGAATTAAPPKQWHTQEWRAVVRDMERSRARMAQEAQLKHKTDEEVQLYEYRKKQGYDIDARVHSTKRQGYQEDRARARKVEARLEARRAARGPPPDEATLRRQAIRARPIQQQPSALSLFSSTAKPPAALVPAREAPAAAGAGEERGRPGGGDVSRSSLRQAGSSALSLGAESWQGSGATAVVVEPGAQRRLLGGGAAGEQPSRPPSLY